MNAATGIPGQFAALGSTDTDPRRLWRTLEELIDAPEFRRRIENEFPAGVGEWHDGLSRRNFLKLMGASLALAGFAGCGSPPSEKRVPYLRQPELVVPGRPLFFATAMPLGGYGIGLLVESHEGRPTKVEGNPDQPASLGATNSFAQASVLDLYDPDRSSLVINRGNGSNWGRFVEELNDRMSRIGGRQGAGLRILSESVTSPTLLDQRQRLLEQFPRARWHCFEPVNRNTIHEGTRLAFGRPLHPIYDLAKADRIVSLDSDFLCDEPGGVRYARDFASRRRVRAPGDRMNRLYVAEPSPTVTGSMADHRLPVRSRDVIALAGELARALGVETDTEAAALDPRHSRWLKAAAGDLRQHHGAGLIVAGPSQPPAVHALVHLMNERLGNIGKTLRLAEPIEADPLDHRSSLGELVGEMKAGTVELLIILGGNPVYAAPVDLDFGGVLKAWAKSEGGDESSRRLAVHLSTHYDETSFQCHWHLPRQHYLETWSDIRAYDGTVSIIQPLIAPLYRGTSDHELLGALTSSEAKSAHDIVRDYWRHRTGEENFDNRWDAWLERGIVPGTAASAVSVKPAVGRLESRGAAHAAQSEPVTESTGGFEIVFRPDPTIWDGRFANNGWQQELPKPISHLTWDNAAQMGVNRARELNLAHGDIVSLKYRGRSVKAPVQLMPGQHDDVVTVTLGYGRWQVGHVGENAGFNAYLIRTSEAPWFEDGLEIEPTGEKMLLSNVDAHHAITGGPPKPDLMPVVVATATTGSSEPDESNRLLVRTATLAAFNENPRFAKDMEEESAKPPLKSLFPEYEYKDYKWGMTIDLSACIGCMACVVGCQAENNTPVVGKEQVIAGREMHWLRVDKYFRGSVGDPEIFHQPVPCMQCENAPCELVCPVGATVHDHEGINNMVYNRCVGTRYCSNNCPYKVRRFNFLNYSDDAHPTIAMQKNPNVSVRARGVMEKCTYCIQRISAARIDAEKENRRVRDGELQTACQQACPTQAIVFGDLNDKRAEVSRLKKSPLEYGLLTELTTVPRTTYLARVTNPNPNLEAEFE